MSVQIIQFLALLFLICSKLYRVEQREEDLMMDVYKRNIFILLFVSLAQTIHGTTSGS